LLFGDVADYVTVDHLSIIVLSPPWQFDWSEQLWFGHSCFKSSPNFPTSNVMGGAKFGWYPDSDDVLH